MRESQFSQLDGEALEYTDSDTTTNDFSDFPGHSTESEDPEVYNCETCGFKTNHKTGLKIHVKKVHKIECDQCDLAFGKIEKARRCNFIYFSSNVRHK